MVSTAGAATGAPSAGTTAGSGARGPSATEISGAARIKWGALAGLLGLALSIAGIVVALTALPIGSVAITSAAGSQAIMNRIFAGVLAVVVGVFLAFLAFVLYVAGFRSLRMDDGRFRVPMVLGLVGLVGLLLVGTFMIFYAAAFHSALACAASDVTCQNNATTLAHGVVALGYAGGLLGFVGLVGTIVGLYRFGSRYSNSLAKVGGVLYIVPFLAILAPLLVLIGAHQVQKQLGAQPPAAVSVPPTG